jgi:hypothetical protein
MIVKADKGNATIVLTLDYNQTYDFLNSDDFIPLNTDPTLSKNKK